MMRSIATLITLGLLSGCVGSLAPIYDEEDLIFDPALLGVWTDEDSSDVYILGEGPEMAYSVAWFGDGCEEWTFSLHLVGIDGFRFLDAHVELPYDWPAIPIHGVALIAEQADSAVALRVLDDDWLDDYLQTNPEAIAHLDDGLLTATTADLQEFYLAHIRTPDAFDEPDTLTRLSDEAAERMMGHLMLTECPDGFSWFGSRTPPEPPPPRGQQQR